MRSTARALLAACHPGPTAVVTVVSTGLAFSVALPLSTILLVAATILANQLSIGWSNDAIDAARDREVGRLDKPVARDAISARALLGWAIAAGVVAVGLSLLLGPAAAVAHALLLGAGWTYNLGLKRTVAATACYAIGFGALPSVVTLANEPPAVAAPWATAAGALLGIAAHFANFTPDRDDDRRHRMRAIPHRLAPRASIALAIMALAIASALGIYGAAAAGPIGLISAIGAGVAMACVAAAGILLVRAPQSRWLFRIVMLSAVSAVVTLVGAGTLSG